MSHLLHLDTSARPNSASRALTARFAETWSRAPGTTRAYRDLAADPVPPIGEGWTHLCDELLRRGLTDPVRYREAVTTPAAERAWAVVEPLLAELLAADVVVIGCPMYNYSVPGALKTWIDQVTFPRMSLTGRRFAVLGARGGAYGPGTPREPYDHQERYLRDFLAGHFAVEDVTFAHAELTNTAVDPLLAHLTEAHRDSVAAAESAVDALAADWAARS
ncbi:NAD(P)H-dependent oxidoreductase [Actinokineospora auranticolor]|uniref:FMN dependent NADH:quinone oxidoreductase n=1 Tax=Actinokineospora auranticolor TaxID=155976 RepID=A0A2S6GSV6_9PSEU|nr:NAD(P)H-dependent oxidoreductase [Actinokineospora auranticolor]PPK68335.1 FMN-dependent NADH-azoreductase [Actinokineospora auranticolor]